MSRKGQLIVGAVVIAGVVAFSIQQATTSRAPAQPAFTVAEVSECHDLIEAMRTLGVIDRTEWPSGGARVFVVKSSFDLLTYEERRGLGVAAAVVADQTGERGGWVQFLDHRTGVKLAEYVGGLGYKTLRE